MSTEATNAPDLPRHLPDEAARKGLTERARHIAEILERAVVDIWLFVRFVFFVVFLLLATVAFWLSMLSVLVSLVRLVFSVVMWVFLWLAGGTPPRPGPPVGAMTALRLDLKRRWDERNREYEAITRPLARQLVRARQIGRTFWYWSWFFKGVAAAVLGVTVLIPALYIVPRPHDVQITDDNAVDYDKKNNKTTYLVHALDMHTPGKTREYLNEDAWYLGKINSQGLKSKLQIGHTYRLWVVGIRWYYMPTMYPNIISATEIDEQFNAVKNPRRLQLAAPGLQQTPAPAQR